MDLGEGAGRPGRRAAWDRTQDKNTPPHSLRNARVCPNQQVAGHTPPKTEAHGRTHTRTPLTLNENAELVLSAAASRARTTKRCTAMLVKGGKGG